MQALVEDGEHSVAEMMGYLKHFIPTELCCNNLVTPIGDIIHPTAH